MKIDGPEPRPPRMTEVENRHPTWSRILYAIYGLATLGAGVAAYHFGYGQLAIGAAVIAAVLLWKAGQKVR